MSWASAFADLLFPLGTDDMTKTAHSELPWRGGKMGYVYAKDGRYEVQVGKIGDFADKEIAKFNRDRWQADVDLIVKAVNSYDKMRELLEWLDRKGGLGIDVHERIRSTLTIG